MDEPSNADDPDIPAARAGSKEAIGGALEACRGYLLGIAERELDADLRAKGGASDLVQDTFLEAQRDFAGFRGETQADLLAWLRRLLLNNLANFARTYRQTASAGSIAKFDCRPAAIRALANGGLPPTIPRQAPRFATAKKRRPCTLPCPDSRMITAKC